VFFADSDQHPAVERAGELLPVLNAAAVSRAPQRGDPFPDRYDFAAYDPGQVQRVFGDSELSHKVFVAPVGKWSGPYHSGYGWHLVYVDARRGRAVASFEAIRARVRTDYLQNEQDVANDAALAKLASSFTVVVPGSSDPR